MAPQINIVKKSWILPIIILISCNPQEQPTKTSQYPQLAVSGNEVWKIDNKDYHIEATYLIVFPDKTVQFTINYLSNDDLDMGALDNERAIDITFPIFKYAYENKLYESKHVWSKGQELKASKIGVAIISKNTIGKPGIAHLSKARGYRIALSLDDIKARLDNLRP